MSNTVEDVTISMLIRELGYIKDIEDRDLFNYAFRKALVELDTDNRLRIIAFMSMVTSYITEQKGVL